MPVSCKTGYAEILAGLRYDSRWSLPSQATEGDLILFYRTRPDSFIRDVFRVAGSVVHVRAGWKAGRDWMGPIRRVATLKTPLHLEEMQSHRILGEAGFIRGNMRRPFRVAFHWPEFLELIQDRNPSLRRTLARFGAERLK